MDFTIKTYKLLLQTLISKGYAFQTFCQFLKKPLEKVIVLRHDVDLLPLNSLRFAKIQHEVGICGSYYFRMVTESYNESIIKEIASLGHEIGYHYETMDTTSSKFKVQSLKFKDKDEERDVIINGAYEEFCKNLEHFRTLCPVKTICMHGSPRSKFDNREIWKHFSYKELGLIGEPYFDIDFNKVFYLTDTGRRWDGYKVSVRDKMPQQETWNSQGLRFSSTNDIVRAINHEKFPHQVMFTFHPQRWNNSLLPWAKEFAWQNVKNVVKGIIIRETKN